MLPVLGKPKLVLNIYAMNISPVQNNNICITVRTVVDVTTPSICAFRLHIEHATSTYAGEGDDCAVPEIRHTSADRWRAYARSSAFAPRSVGG